MRGVDRPILMSAPMVRAILDDSKTHTRRTLKPQPGGGAAMVECCKVSDEGWQIAGHSGLWWDEAGDIEPVWRCPYGVPGDRLWVREAWRVESRCDDIPPRDLVHDWPVHYEAGVWSDLRNEVVNIPGTTRASGRLRPSIHMPRWASRITLEITGVRVERLNDISEADAIAEGADPLLVPPDGGSAPYTDGYRMLWEKINGPESWAANPWVWVVVFRREPGAAA